MLIQFCQLPTSSCFRRHSSLCMKYTSVKSQPIIELCTEPMYWLFIQGRIFKLVLEGKMRWDDIDYAIKYMKGSFCSRNGIFKELACCAHIAHEVFKTLRKEIDQHSDEMGNNISTNHFSNELWIQKYWKTNDVSDYTSTELRTYEMYVVHFMNVFYDRP